jgi:hypothetical protein
MANNHYLFERTSALLVILNCWRSVGAGKLADYVVE